jgi:hypothetical protein
MATAPAYTTEQAKAILRYAFDKPSRELPDLTAEYIHRGMIECYITDLVEVVPPRVPRNAHMVPVGMLPDPMCIWEEILYFEECGKNPVGHSLLKYRSYWQAELTMGNAGKFEYSWADPFTGRSRRADLYCHDTGFIWECGNTPIERLHGALLACCDDRDDYVFGLVSAPYTSLKDNLTFTFVPHFYGYLKSLQSDMGRDFGV